MQEGKEKNKEKKTKGKQINCCLGLRKTKPK